MIAPLYVGQVAGRPLRMFRSPRPLGEMPWHSVDDFRACLNITRQQYRRIERSVPDEFALARTIVTPQGPVLIGPHSLARMIITSSAGLVTPAFMAEYAIASRSAFHMMTSVLSEDSKRRYAGVAMRV